MSTTLEHIRWTLDHDRNCTIHEQELLLSVAEAAVAEWDTHRIWQDANDNLDDTDETWDAIWQKIDSAHDAFRAAIGSLLEEKE